MVGSNLGGFVGIISEFGLTDLGFNGNPFT